MTPSNDLPSPDSNPLTARPKILELRDSKSAFLRQQREVLKEWVAAGMKVQAMTERLDAAFTALLAAELGDLPNHRRHKGISESLVRRELASLRQLTTPPAQQTEPTPRPKPRPKSDPDGPSLFKEGML